MELKEFSWTGLGREAKAQRGLRKSRGDRMCLGICETGHVCLFNPPSPLQSETSFRSHWEISHQEVWSAAPSLGLHGPSQNIKTYLRC